MKLADKLVFNRRQHIKKDLIKQIIEIKCGKKQPIFNTSKIGRKPKLCNQNDLYINKYIKGKLNEEEICLIKHIYMICKKFKNKINVNYRNKCIS